MLGSEGDVHQFDDLVACHVPVAVAVAAAPHRGWRRGDFGGLRRAGCWGVRQTWDGARIMQKYQAVGTSVCDRKI